MSLHTISPLPHTLIWPLTNISTMLGSPILGDIYDLKLLNGLLSCCVLQESKHFGNLRNHFATWLPTSNLWSISLSSSWDKYFPFSVVPQPVYMNMSDLERMRQQKLQQQHSQEEDGFDLKTPTQEDLDAMPPSSSSDGSSSGYGSQGMVCEQQAYNDGKCHEVCCECWSVLYMSTCVLYHFSLSLPFIATFCWHTRRDDIEICPLLYTHQTSDESTQRYINMYIVQYINVAFSYQDLL